MTINAIVAAAIASSAAAQPRPTKATAPATAPATTPARSPVLPTAPPPAPIPADPSADSPAAIVPASDDAAAEPASDPDARPPAPPPATPATAEEERAEIAALQTELSQVMDDLVQARTRVAVLGKSLFQTKVRVKLDNRAAPDQSAARVLLWLDGAPIFSGDGGALRDPERALWEGFAAPGAHVLTMEIEQHARGDDAYRYTLRESYRFTVVREHRTDLRLVLEDDSDMAEEFPDDHEGSYEVQTRLEARAVRAGDD